METWRPQPPSCQLGKLQLRNRGEFGTALPRRRQRGHFKCPSELHTSGFRNPAWQNSRHHSPGQEQNSKLRGRSPDAAKLGSFPSRKEIPVLGTVFPLSQQWLFSTATKVNLSATDTVTGKFRRHQVLCLPWILQYTLLGDCSSPAPVLLYHNLDCWLSLKDWI